MNEAIAANGLEPVIDRRFDFAEAPDAYRHMEAAGHFGKITIALPG
jgi:NADPH:quinone reductase-like Zn-dependent oxidoreductase